MNNSKKEKIAIAMSGGVDSSVAAVLLSEQGHSVFGITMVHYDSQCHRDKQAVEDAQKVCHTLGLDHHVIEIKKEFRQNVIDDFINEYMAGRTPNPCVRCNPRIKWGHILEKSLELGADAFATGHYCRITFNPDNKRYILSKAAHQHKDQSYALWALSQEQLKNTRFPLSGLTKPEVRELAAKAGLVISDKQESQEICFIEDDDYKRFLNEELAAKGRTISEGNILDMDNNVLGQHKGYPFYTIGQRKGLGIAVGRPIYVTEINAENNTIRVGDKKDLLSAGLTATDANWISVKTPEPGTQVIAHIRYNDPGFPATIINCNAESFEIQFEQPRASVTPGQSVVLYINDQLYGGGIINKPVN